MACIWLGEAVSLLFALLVSKKGIDSKRGNDSGYVASHALFGRNPAFALLAGLWRTGAKQLNWRYAEL
jgi:hypothetical protein